MTLSSCAVLAASGRLDALSKLKYRSPDGPRRQLTVQSSSFVKSLVLGAAATAAVGAVIVLKNRHQNSQQSILQQPGQRRQRRQRQEQGEHGGGGSWLAVTQTGLGLGWALHDRDKQLSRQVQDIEQQQQREAQRELARWDERWHLRSRPLAELRALAAQHRIPGRSRMRKQELVSALEAELGFVQLPAPVKAAQPAPGQRLPDEA